MQIIYNRVFFSSFLLLLIGFCEGCTNSDASVSGELPPVELHAASLSSPVDSGVFMVGDNLELFVKEDPTLNNTYAVRDGGYIVIPRAGRIEVAGLSRPKAEAQVKAALQRTQLTEATVLVERSSKQSLLSATPGTASSVPKIMVYVTGAVPRPGSHYIPLPAGGRPLGVYETLLITGGLNRLAHDQRVEVMRVDSNGRRHRAIFDLRRVRQGTAEDPSVGEGDIIHVPEKVFGF